MDTLNLQHNRLNTVPARVFSHLKLLNSLELENNQIRNVDPDAFAGLEGKVWISIQHLNVVIVALVWKLG